MRLMVIGIAISPDFLLSSWCPKASQGDLSGGESCACALYLGTSKREPSQASIGLWLERFPILDWSIRRSGSCLALRNARAAAHLLNCLPACVTFTRLIQANASFPYSYRARGGWRARAIGAIMTAPLLVFARGNPYTACEWLNNRSSVLSPPVLPQSHRLFVFSTDLDKCS